MGGFLRSAHPLIEQEKPMPLALPASRIRRARATLCAGFTLALACAAPAHAASENYVLALSWEPEFCYGHASKPECQTETSGRWDANHLSLHGLWPQSGSYCGVSSQQKSEDQNGQWDLLPAVVLGSTTEQKLQVEMPGTMSYLDRHEWIEHGTCSGYSQQNFFAPTLAMLDSVNASNLGATISAYVGSHVSLAQLQQAAALDFGQYASADIEYLCTYGGGRYYLSELRFHLHLPSPLPSSVLPSYLAKPASTSSQRCKSTSPIYIERVD
jgi:ribonuclease T2